MANDLTGEFDVVAEFAIPAANRLFAYMHACERFPHSLSMHVDDTHPPGPGPFNPVVTSSVNMLGDAVASEDHIGTTGPHHGAAAAADFFFSGVDAIVNTGNAGFLEVPPTPSLLKGRVQLQLSAPAVELSGNAGANVTARLAIMARYFPDPQTAPLAECVRGELRLTVPVSQVSSQTANVVVVDLKAAQLGISFQPLFSSQPITPEGLAGVNLLIRNAFKTSFLPSNSTLPSNVRFLQLKTLAGSQNAIALLLNLNTARGSAAGYNRVFLGGSDDFAFGVSADLVRAAFQPALDKILATPIDPVRFDLSIYIHTFHITYIISLASATVAFESGRIVLTLTGHAHTTSYLPDFNFTAKQSFTLQPDGATANLVVGSMSLDTSSTIVNIFKSRATSRFATVRDHALSQSNVFASVRKILSADANLGGFLRSLLTRPAQSNLPQPQNVSLTYTSVTIQTSGVVLHGSMSVPGLIPARVEFEKLPASAGPADVIAGAPQYTALKSWIPGGGIQRFEWSHFGQPQPFNVDENRFVLKPAVDVATAGTSTTAARVIPGYGALCLTIRGSRLSSSGPVVAQPVAATACAWGRFPVINGLKASLGKSLPEIALTQPGPDGLTQIIGHTAALVDRAGSATPNLIVHFGDERSSQNLAALSQAFEQSKRTDAPTAILAVVPEANLARARYSAGVIYARDTGEIWAQVFGVQHKKRPFTLVLGPGGHIRYQHEGAIEVGALAAALSKSLVARPAIEPRILATSLTLNQQSPNFLLPVAPGYELPLRKLAGRPVTLVFWRSGSKPSIDAVLDHQKAAGKGADDEPVLLAINDGDASAQIAEATKQHGITATVVEDPKRDIALAYGINIWPTTVSLDANGRVKTIRYGRMSAAASRAPASKE